MSTHFSPVKSDPIKLITAKLNMKLATMVDTPAMPVTKYTYCREYKMR